MIWKDIYYIFKCLFIFKIFQTWNFKLKEYSKLKYIILLAKSLRCVHIYFVKHLNRFGLEWKDRYQNIYRIISTNFNYRISETNFHIRSFLFFCSKYSITFYLRCIVDMLRDKKCPRLLQDNFNNKALLSFTNFLESTGFHIYVYISNQLD